MTEATDVRIKLVRQMMFDAGIPLGGVMPSDWMLTQAGYSPEEIGEIHRRQDPIATVPNPKYPDEVCT
jgi:hypothetical protein